MHIPPTDTELLQGRIREQEQALADLAIERRSDKLTITMLRLRCLDLERSLERTREGSAHRKQQVEDLEQRLRRARLASAAAQRTLARLRQREGGGAEEAAKWAGPS